MSKLQKAMIALSVVASIGIVAPQAASAHGGGHGGGGGGGHGGFGGFGGGGHGGFGGGGFHGGGYHGFHNGYGFGLGLFAPYYYGYPYYDYPDVGYDEGYYPGECYIVHHRVHTRHGWRYRVVHVCE